MMIRLNHRWHIWPILLMAGIVFTGAIDRQTRDALKVQHILKTIERQPPRTDDKERTAEITQSELNAYIAWRLAHETDTVINTMTVDLLDNNHVTGKIRFDAARLNLDAVLGEALDFDFKGILVNGDRKARLDLIALSLCGQPVKPQVLDFVLQAAALYYGSAISGLNDWYELPPGVRRITVREKGAVLYY
ncbi:hypothetical protein DSCO28_59830 [Desulfosarcina ovata subsp. sediminis]|uniref:Uncharacterized protein n=1 Tax=Desulfosarcina ovata subsp. sediminis TaxID=885957 RepID=A0A5K7ZYS0_9BACT|nr:hypothetical protein [Desulfosarcina ovata]BBO85417.1 hypothetical protein DSCO28_59830 [Desulfosarcina ovata subsp. sediminis]